MKIYAYSQTESIPDLEPYVGQNIWVPVGWKDRRDDLYGWVKILYSKISSGGTCCYISVLIKLDDVIVYHNHIAHGDSDDWKNYIQRYTFAANHFDLIDTAHLVTTEELDDEFDAIYARYCAGRDW